MYPVSNLNLVSQFEFSLTICILSDNMNSVSQFISFYDDSCALASVLQAWGKAGVEGEENGSVVILIGNELPENLLEKTNMRRFWEISEVVFLPQI